MRFAIFYNVALSTLASLVTAGGNPIISPVAGSTIQAGSTVDIKWSPTAGGTVNLILRYGPSDDLLTGAPVASQITNSGSYSWKVPTNIGNGQWSIAITDGKDSDTNYSPMFNVIGGTGSQGSPGSKATTTEARVTETAKTTTTIGSLTVATVIGSVSTTTVPGSSTTKTTKTGTTMTMTSMSTSVTLTESATLETATGAAVRLGWTEGLAAIAGLGALAALA